MVIIPFRYIYNISIIIATFNKKEIAAFSIKFLCTPKLLTRKTGADKPMNIQRDADLQFINARSSPPLTGTRNATEWRFIIDAKRVEHVKIINCLLVSDDEYPLSLCSKVTPLVKKSMSIC